MLTASEAREIRNAVLEANCNDIFVYLNRLINETSREGDVKIKYKMPKFGSSDKELAFIIEVLRKKGYNVYSDFSDGHWTLDINW